MNDFVYINSSIPLNEMVRLYGTSWFVYAGTLYGITPLSIFGTIMNLIAFLILCKKPFQNSVFFKYLRLNTFNSLILSLILTTRFATTMYKFDFTNTYAASFYREVFYTPILYVIYMYGNLLDIIIIVERLLYVHPIEILKKIVNFKYLWVILITSCFLLSIPNFFATSTDYINIMLNNSTLIRNYYSKKTEFIQSTFGQVMAFTLFFIRDVLTLIIKVILNIISVILVKNHLKKKKTRISNLKTNDAQTNNKISNEQFHIDKVNREQTYIAMVMTVLSSLENLSFVVSNAYLILSLDQSSRIVYFLSNFVILIKHASNLIIYFYNFLFRKEFLKLFTGK